MVALGADIGVAGQALVWGTGGAREIEGSVDEFAEAAVLHDMPRRGGHSVDYEGSEAFWGPLVGGVTEISVKLGAFTSKSAFLPLS